MKCYNCQQMGHTKQDCPNESTTATAQARYCDVSVSDEEDHHHHIEEAEAQMRVASGLGRTLRRAKATATIKGEAATIAVYFDSGSNANFLSSRVFVPGVDRPLQVKHHGGKTYTCRYGHACFTSGKEEFKVFGWLSENVPANCDVLLGDHSILQLEVMVPESTEATGRIGDLPDLEVVRKTRNPVRVPMRQPIDESSPVRETGKDCMSYWSNIDMQRYLTDHPICFPETAYEWTQVEVNEDLPRWLKRAIKKVLKRCAKVFKSGSVPPINQVYKRRHGAVDARQYLKEGFKPFHSRAPRWADAHARFLNEFRKHALKHGIIRECPDSPWVMRVIVVSKGDGAPRLCLDLRPLNGMMRPIRFRISNGLEMLLRISIAMNARISADVMGAYWQYALDEHSQELFCFWLPVETSPGVYEARKYAFQVLPFGWSLSPFILARHMEEVLGKMKPETRKFMATFYDDFSGGTADGPDWEQKFLDMVDDFFTVLMQEGVVLKSTKCRVGFPTGTFYGFELGKDGSNGMGEKFLSGLDAFVEPTTPREVKSILGTLNVARDYVKDFATLAAPVQALTRKDVHFDWTPECTQAVEKIVAILRSGVKHYKPRDDLQLFLATDASDVGAGGHLYQMVPVEGAGDKTVRRTIAFFSKAWTATMRRRPVFYREAWAMLHFLAKSRVFAMSNQFPVMVQTDHATLQWVKRNDKGAVTSFLLDELKDMRFEVQYNSGSSKVISVPDSLSRYPMLGPRTWAWGGLEAFYYLLRRVYRKALQNSKRVWVYAGTDTVKLRPLVKADTSSASILVQAPIVGRYPTSADFAVLAPKVDRAPEICAELLRVGQPGAVLVPTDLVGRIVEQVDAEHTEAVAAALEQASFVGSAGSMFMWVVCNAGKKCDVVVAAALATTGRSLLNAADWTAATDFPPDSALKDGTVAIDGEGIRWYHPKDRKKLRRLLVPVSAQEKVVQVVHEESVGHLGVRQTLHEVKERFFWPGMRKTVQDVVMRCEDCNHIKGARVLGHGRFRGEKYGGPRLVYSIDIKKASPDGGSILGVVDVFDGYTALMPLRNRQQGLIITTLLNEVFLIYGFPAAIRTDDAKEFGPKFTEQMARWGIKHTTTRGYHGQGNAHVERMWATVKALFRATKTMVDWVRQLKMIAFAINTGVKEAFGMSPFEVHFGLPAVSALHAGSLTSDEVDEETPNLRELETLQDLWRANVHRCRAAGDYNRAKQAEKANEASRKPVEFQVGDLVMAYREPKGIHTKYYSKLSDFVPKWFGPLKVLSRVGESYELEASTDGPTTTKGQIFERTVMNLAKYDGEAVKNQPQNKTVPAPRLRRVTFSVVPGWRRGGELLLKLPDFDRTFTVSVPAWAKVGDAMWGELDTITGELRFGGRVDQRKKKQRNVV